MAYIGNSPANIGNYQIVDDIASGFNGSLVSFALASGGIAITPAKSGQILANINGVMQEPDDGGTNGFKVTGSNIVFSSAPANGDTFWAVYQGQNVDIGTPSDDVVDTAHIKDDAVTADKLANSINTAIAANTAKTGITTSQASAITANTAKTGITSSQATAITAALPKAGGTMTGDLVTTSVEIVATNSGSPFNVLKFTDADTGTAPNQAVGSIEFNSSDTGNTGVGAKIDAIAEDYDSNMAVRIFTGDPSSATEKMRINSSGNVGIGASSAGGKLEIHQEQVTGQFDRDCFLRLHPSAHTNSGGFTNMMFGTSTTNNYGVAIGGLRAGTDNAPSFRINMLNDSVSGFNALTIDPTGAVTMPSQPAFQGQNSLTGNLVVNSLTTVTFSEIFDQNSDFSSTTFTAPVTGKYQLNVHLLVPLDSAATYYQLQLHTSNRLYYETVDPDFGQDNAYYCLQVAVLADMDASDTAIVKIIQSGGSQQSDINTTTSKFSGFLAC